MTSSQWFVVIAIVVAASFLGGYQLSARTGSEPGYFEAVAAAGYGGGGEAKIKGLTDDMHDYYKSLLK
jgi:hypothetical protein